MKNQHPTGLGSPQPAGKLSLFQPPQEVTITPMQEGINTEEIFEPIHRNNPSPQKRIRTTIDLTREALVILQQVQQEYRLTTGKVLPLWKALSQVIIAYHSHQ
jgi:hypothetical protein